MKKQIIILALGLGLSLVPSALAAPDASERYLDLYRDSDARPKPLSIVCPEVRPHDSGTELDLLIEIEPTGRPGRITTRSSVSPALLRSLKKAVSQWEFAPRHNANGHPTRAKVRLPVLIR